MENNEKPKILYHYCSLETFAKIIETKTLRFSDITKSNDSDEVVFLWNKYSEYLKKNCDIYQMLFMKNEIEKQIKSVKYFAICLTELEDSLYFWNSYANGGIAIGFNTEQLEKWINCINWDIQGDKQKNNGTNPIKLFKVDYYSKAEFDVRLEAIFKGFNAETGILGNIPQLTPYVKNDFFEVENEWRITFAINISDSCSQNLIKLNYLKNISILPKISGNSKNYRLCYDIPFREDIIEKIVLSSNNPMTEQDIKIALLKVGVDLDIEKITRSKGTLAYF